MFTQLKLQISVAVLVMTGIGCATVPETRVYRQADGAVHEHLTLTAVMDHTPGQSIPVSALDALRTDLAGALEASGHFRSVRIADNTDESPATVVACRITQFDTAARRMSVVAELSNPPEERPFVRLVAHTELVSMVWPIDYIDVMERAGQAVARDLSASIISVYNEGKKLP